VREDGVPVEALDLHRPTHRVLKFVISRRFSGDGALSRKRPGSSPLPSDAPPCGSDALTRRLWRGSCSPPTREG
jgi:hypothetical protein